ncbi:MAG: cytochrome c [Candidatus Eremiobacteraeota bacterium]|nr:cytochrome c [Candidatus Eremiobacteraeota bacterium]
MEGGVGTPPPTSIAIFLDDQAEPLFTYRPPATFQLDTTKLEDGDHVLRLCATDAMGNVGQRRVPFTVSNGPGITVTGIRAGSSVHGMLDINVNAFSGEEPFDPERAESHAPIPVWTWVMCAMVAAWALWYGLEFFQTPAEFANTPTYAANPALAAAAQPASGSVALHGPTFSGKGAAAGFDYEAFGTSAYEANCMSCHGAGGAGVADTFPALAGDPVVTDNNPRQHVVTLLKGLQGKVIAGKSFAAAMPSFSQLSDQDIAAIVDHERTSWGNHAPIITPGDVKRAR